MYFSFDFVWYTIHIDVVHSEQGEGGLLNGQNPLKATKVICRQFLISQKLLVLIFYQPLKDRQHKY